MHLGPIKNDLKGRRFGRLLVQRFEGYTETLKRKRLWYCLCDCGTFTIVRESSLLRGTTLSCSCYRYEALRAANIKHGHYINGKASKTITAYLNMMRRCYEQGTRQYQYYGGRGIKVCERWKADFKNFLEDMGDCPQELTLERMDTNGNYEPSNCKWATWEEQQNNRRNNKARQQETKICI